MDYCELTTQWVTSARVDEELRAAFFVDEDEKGFICLDVLFTVREKARYAKAVGFAGIFYWTGAGDIDGPKGLAAAGWRGSQEL